MPYTLLMVDVAFISLVLLFAVIGFTTGFLMQVFRLLSLFGAIFLSFIASNYSGQVFPEFLSVKPELRTGVIALLTFVLAYIAFVLIAQNLVKAIRTVTPMLSFLDRVIGALLGACKGVIVSLFLVLVLLYSTKGQSLGVLRSDIISFIQKDLPHFVQLFSYSLERKGGLKNKNER